MLVVISERVENQQGNLSAHVYIKALKALKDREPGDDEVMRYLESWAYSRNHIHDFFCLLIVNKRWYGGGN